MEATQTSLPSEIIVVVGIAVSTLFSFIISYGIIRSKGIIDQQQYTSLLSTGVISGISCLTPFIFIATLGTSNTLPFNLQYVIPSVIIALIYLSQSIIPFLTIFQAMELFESRNQSKPVIRRIPTTDTDTTDTFDQLDFDENKNAKPSICIYTVYSIITLALVVLANYASPYWLQIILMLFPYFILELCFIIFGTKIYYSHMYEVSINVIPYILIRSIIIAFTLPVIIMDFNINVTICYISFGVITISILAVLTIVLPSLLVQNKQRRKRVLTTENVLENEFGSPETHFKQLKSSSFTKDQIDRMKIIISNFEENAEESDQKFDGRQKQGHDHLDVNGSKNLHRSSTSKNILATQNTETFSQLSIYSRTSNNAAGISITGTPLRDRTFTPINPELDKKISKSRSKTKLSRVSTTQNTTTQITTTQETSTVPNDSTTYDHHNAENTDTFHIGSRIQEQVEMTRNEYEL